MKKRELLVVSVILAALAIMFCGCNEAQKAPQSNIKSLNQQLLPAPQEWKDAYGDALETQIAYNLVVLRNNDMVIAGTMNILHPADANDPNNLKVRIEALEANAIMEGEMVRGKIIDKTLLKPWETSVILTPMYIYKVDPNE